MIEKVKAISRRSWLEFWMSCAGQSKLGRLAAWMAFMFAPPYKDARSLCWMNKKGYISPYAKIDSSSLRLGRNIFIDDHVMIYRNRNGGHVYLGDEAVVLRDSIIETEDGGRIEIGERTWIHQRCNLTAAKEAILIAADVMVAANCSFYPHSHTIKSGVPIVNQPIYSKGPIIIGDNSWIGTRVVVLGGVTIGAGAVIGAGSVVTKDIPANAVAFGVPARVVKMRG
jgi:acetyltransferase-like isoleucine patch superfamily enzyme